MASSNNLIAKYLNNFSSNSAAVEEMLPQYSWRAQENILGSLLGLVKTKPGSPKDQAWVSERPKREPRIFSLNRFYLLFSSYFYQIADNMSSAIAGGISGSTPPGAPGTPKTKEVKKPSRAEDAEAQQEGGM